MKVEHSWTATNNDVSGTFSFDATTGVASVLSDFNLAALTTDQGTHALGTGTCANGTLSLPNDTGDLFLTTAGGAIVHTSPSMESTGDDGIIFALPPAAAAIVPSSLAGNYAGLAFASGADSDFPVSLTLTANGSGVSGPGVKLTDVTTGTPDTGGALITLSTAGTANGVVNGTMDTTSTTGGGMAEPMTCVVQQHAGTNSQTVMACATIDANSQKFFSIVLASH